MRIRRDLLALLILIAIGLGLQKFTNAQGITGTPGWWIGVGAPTDNCMPGQPGMQTDATPGRNLWACTGLPNIWTQLTGITGPTGPTGPAGSQFGSMGKLINAQLNTTADQSFAITTGGARYVPRRIIMTNCSGTPIAAAGGIYTATSKSGTAIVGAAQLYTALTGLTRTTDLVITAIGGTTSYNNSTLYFSLTVANLLPLTCDLYFYGDPLT